MPKVLSAGTTAADRRRAAAGDAEGPKKKFRVRPGQTVTLGEDREDGTVMVSYSAGEEVELTDSQAKAMPWAVDIGERRARSGQPSRMKARMLELEAENNRLKAEAKARTKKDDAGRKQAQESLLARGDNFIGRGEPQAGSVPAEVLDDHDRRLMADEFGFGEGGDLESDDELAGGMHGIARGTAGAEGGKSGATGAIPGQTGTGNAPASQPAKLEPGQSQRPGESEPSGEAGKQ